MGTIDQLLSRAFERAIVGGVLERAEVQSGGADERVVCERVGGRARARVALEPPLDLGLRADEAVAEGILRRGARTGDPAFDRSFRVMSDEDARAGLLFTAPVRAAMLAARKDALAPEVTDEEVSVTGDEAWDLDRARASAEELARLVDEARAKVPCARVLREIRTALSSFAAREGLRLEGTPLRLSGRIDDQALRLHVVRTAFEEFTATIEVELPLSLGLGLVLVREGSGAALLARARSVPLAPVQSPELARLFVAHAQDPEEALGRTVDGRVAEALVRCARIARDVAIGDQRIVVELRCTPDDPGEPLEVTRAALEVGRLLSENVQLARARHAGPYR